MNKQEIEKRLEELAANAQNRKQIIVQAQADLNAIDGALQDCQFWLSKISEAEIIAQHRDAAGAELDAYKSDDDFIPMQETAPVISESH